LRQCSASESGCAAVLLMAVIGRGCKEASRLGHYRGECNHQCREIPIVATRAAERGHKCPIPFCTNLNGQFWYVLSDLRVAAISAREKGRQLASIPCKAMCEMQQGCILSITEYPTGERTILLATYPYWGVVKTSGTALRRWPIVSVPSLGLAFLGLTSGGGQGGRTPPHTR
jgi:hypothetical protein